MNKGKLSLDEEKKLVSLRQEGWFLYELEKEFKIADPAVRRILKKHGVYQKSVRGRCYKKKIVPPLSEETKRKISQGQSRSWSSGSRQQQMKVSQVELSIQEELSQFNFHHSGSGSWWRTGKDGRTRNPDYISDSQKRVVEVWGTYWHRDKPGVEHETVEQCKKWWRELGYECLVIWEDQVDTVRELLFLEWGLH